MLGYKRWWSMQSSTPQIPMLYLTCFEQAYRSALEEVRGRPQWKRGIGVKRIRLTMVMAIVAAASIGIFDESRLAEEAVSAVKKSYMTLLN